MCFWTDTAIPICLEKRKERGKEDVKRMADVIVEYYLLTEGGEGKRGRRRGGGKPFRRDPSICPLHLGVKGGGGGEKKKRKGKSAQLFLLCRRKKKAPSGKKLPFFRGEGEKGEGKKKKKKMPRRTRQKKRKEGRKLLSLHLLFFKKGEGRKGVSSPSPFITKEKKNSSSQKVLSSFLKNERRKREKERKKRGSGPRPLGCKKTRLGRCRTKSCGPSGKNCGTKS